ncbi:hypothetical protein BZA77DRAFT_300181, partial [Pyronema omphalodes]
MGIEYVYTFTTYPAVFTQLATHRSGAVGILVFIFLRWVFVLELWQSVTGVLVFGFSTAVCTYRQALGAFSLFFFFMTWNMQSVGEEQLQDVSTEYSFYPFSN